MKYLKETQHICQGNSTYISRRPIKYL